MVHAVVPLRAAAILVASGAVLGCVGGFVLGAADGSVRGLLSWATTLLAALVGGALLKRSPLFWGDAARGSGFRYTGTAGTAEEAAAQEAERAKDWARLQEAASAFEAGADTARSLAWVNAAFARLWCMHHVRELLQPGVSLLQVGCTSPAEQLQLAVVVAAAVFAGSEPRLFLLAMAMSST